MEGFQSGVIVGERAYGGYDCVRGVWGELTDEFEAEASVGAGDYPKWHGELLRLFFDRSSEEVVKLYQHFRMYLYSITP